MKWNYLEDSTKLSLFWTTIAKIAFEEGRIPWDENLWPLQRKINASKDPDKMNLVLELTKVKLKEKMKREGLNENNMHF